MQNEGIRDQCRQLMTLSFKQINEADHQFQLLETMMSTAFSDLTTYLKHQWLYGVVPTPMWNLGRGHFVLGVPGTRYCVEEFGIDFSLKKRLP